MIVASYSVCRLSVSRVASAIRVKHAAFAMRPVSKFDSIVFSGLDKDVNLSRNKEL